MPKNLQFPTPRHALLAKAVPAHYEMGEITRSLGGYDDINLLADNGKGAQMVIKFSPGAGEYDFLAVQNEILSRLDSRRFPQPIPARSGETLLQIELPDGTSGTLRALTFIEGQLLGDSTLTSTLAANFGTFMARFNREVQLEDHLPIRQRRHDWDLMFALRNEAYLPLIPDHGQRQRAAWFFQQFRQQVPPLQDQLPWQTIHGDANDANVLIHGDQIVGMIDFGDMAYAWRIAEVAICLAYLIFRENDPLATASHFLKAYHAEFPLQEAELQVLHCLIGTRIAVSVSNSAKNRITSPENAHIFVSEIPGWKFLEKWIAISPLAAENTFRNACGFPSSPLPTQENLLQARQTHFSKAISLSYGQRPLHMVSASLQYMHAADGRTYLDCVNNIMHVGHGHPTVVRAAQAQMARLNTNTRYLYEGLTAYAEALTATLPAGLDKVFFVNSGSAASDLALRIARAATGRKAMLVLSGGYHGNTEAAIGISAYKYRGKGGNGASPLVYEAPLPDLFRGPWRADDPQAGRRYAAAATDCLVQAENDGQPVAAFIAEAIVGCGGQVPLPPGYLPEVYAQVRARGGCCIADEVQTGFGRVGSHFWAFEQSGVVPDMVILGKPIGNGHPMAAVVCTAALAEAFANGMEFFSSFGGNPVSCAIGQAVLQVIEEEEMQAHAAEVGGWLKSAWRDLAGTYSCIGDVRGSGLFLGLELVYPGPELRADAALAAQVILQLREEGILLSTDGPHHNVIKFKPPMPFNLDNAKTLTAHLKRALATIK